MPPTHVRPHDEEWLDDDIDDETGESEPEWYPLPDWVQQAVDSAEQDEASAEPPEEPPQAQKARWSEALVKAVRAPVPVAIQERVADKITARIEGRIADLDLGTDPRYYQAAVKNLSELILGDVRDGMSAAIVRFWREGLKDVGIGPGEIGLVEAKLMTLQRDGILYDSYAKLAQETSEAVDDALRQGIAQNVGHREMEARLQGVAELSAGRAERIVRTESQHVSNVARAEGYSHIETGGVLYDYHWRGPKYDGGQKVGGRSSEHCRIIKERAQAVREREGRVSIDALLQIVNAVSMELNGPGWEVRDWTPHVNCRHAMSGRPIHG